MYAASAARPFHLESRVLLPDLTLPETASTALPNWSQISPHLANDSQSPANHWITSSSGLKPKTVLHASITQYVGLARSPQLLKTSMKSDTELLDRALHEGIGRVDACVVRKRFGRPWSETLIPVCRVQWLLKSAASCAARLICLAYPLGSQGLTRRFTSCLPRSWPGCPHCQLPRGCPRFAIRRK